MQNETADRVRRLALAAVVIGGGLAVATGAAVTMDVAASHGAAVVKVSDNVLTPGSIDPSSNPSG